MFILVKTVWIRFGVQDEDRDAELNEALDLLGSEGWQVLQIDPPPAGCPLRNGRIPFRVYARMGGV